MQNCRSVSNALNVPSTAPTPVGPVGASESPTRMAGGAQGLDDGAGDVVWI